MDIILPDNLIPRELFAEVIDFLDEENIILLTGAIQTGKTSLYTPINPAQIHCNRRFIIRN